MVSKVEMVTRLEKELLARSLSCTRVAWTLGHASSTMRNNEERAHRHRQRLPVGCAVEARALA
jgi:hypothetical protein